MSADFGFRLSPPIEIIVLDLVGRPPTNHHHVLEQSLMRSHAPCARVAPPADLELPLRSKGERAEEGQGGRAD
jgi:hypothetical protein